MLFAFRKCPKATRNLHKEGNRPSGILASALAALALSIGPAKAACSVPQKMRSEANVIADGRPRLEWTAVAGATAYRVRTQSRVPDGRVIAATDTVVKTAAYLPPQPLAEQRAKVTVRVSAICGEEKSAETVSWFLIDTSTKCRLGEIRGAVKDGSARLGWEPVAGARSYEVRAHGLGDGRLLASLETREPAAQMALPEPAVVSVRPTCVAGLGEAVYRVLSR